LLCFAYIQSHTTRPIAKDTKTIYMLSKNRKEENLAYQTTSWVWYYLWKSHQDNSSTPWSLFYLLHRMFLFHFQRNSSKHKGKVVSFQNSSILTVSYLPWTLFLFKAEEKILESQKNDIGLYSKTTLLCKLWEVTG
jgi:hypothetical protein